LLGRIARVVPDSLGLALLHPAREDVQVSKRFRAITARSWDLRFRSAQRFDALVAARVPSLADEAPFRAALASCQLLIVLEGTAPPVSRPEALTELSVSGGFVRVYRGALTDPLLRVDDYPTGVRPILEDLSSLHDVLSQIDAAGLAFHLGVVPALLDDRMTSFLRGLTQLVVSMHGYEHGYAKHSRILLEAADPLNQRGTVGGFDEFADEAYPEILAKIRAGRRLLESSVGQVARSYIPPCNESNRSTGRALLAAGFEYVLTEKRVPGCELPCIRSDFYDRSSAFPGNLRPNVASLHATWEADMLRAGDAQSLPRFLSALVLQRSHARARIADVAGELQSVLAHG